MSSETRKNGGKPPRILIVDDDAGQRSLLDSFLRSQNFETVLAELDENLKKHGIACLFEKSAAEILGRGPEAAPKVVEILRRLGAI